MYIGRIRRLFTRFHLILTSFSSQYQRFLTIDPENIHVHMVNRTLGLSFSFSSSK